MEIVRIIFWSIIGVFFLIIIFLGLSFKNKSVSNKDLSQERTNGTTTTTPVCTSKNGLWLKIIGGTIAIIFAIMIVILLINIGKRAISKFFDESPSKNSSSAMVICSHQQVYNIPEKGLSVYLHQGWKTFPSGRIKIVTPEGKILHDIPGIKIHFGPQPEGIYKIYSEEEENVSVRIIDTY